MIRFLHERKKCIRCLKVKGIDEYYSHPMMSDGHLNKCKECCKSEALKRREEKIEEIREYDRRRGSLPHRVLARKEYIEKLKEDGKYLDMRRSATNKYRSKNKDKVSARRIVSYHVSVGHIEKKPCEICGDKDSQAHHKDYSFPLDVIWLCDKHHKEEHKRIRQLKMERT